MTTLLSVENVSLYYKSRTGFFKSFVHKALDDVSFTINKGDILGVLGNNGCGKSTLLQILAGIMAPDSGRIINQQNVTCSLLTLGLGFNPQLTGADNAIISCMLNGYSKRESKILANKVREFSELETFFEQPVKTYSAGMRARLGFATALISEVDILLIDETLSVGDSHFKKKAEAALKQKISGDQTVVFVSHSEHQIKALCNKCIWLNKGKVQSYGNTRDVLAQYNSQMT